MLKQYKIPPWEAKRFTIYQLEEICAHARDEHGNLIPWFEGEDDCETPEERKRHAWREQGLTDEECNLLWNEFLDIEGRYRQSLEKQKLPKEEIEERVAAYRDKKQRERRRTR